MKTITIRELHQATGRWVRRASAGEVYVTERGRLVAQTPQRNGIGSHRVDAASVGQVFRLVRVPTSH
jgi:antitoxin (DNA-binding transcriptional repressor) of toxin-antitoxin stability system